MHIDRCGSTHRQKCHAKGSGKEAKLQDFSMFHIEIDKMYEQPTNAF